MGVWLLRGTTTQNAFVQKAIDRCDFDFNKLRGSLSREGKTEIAVDWADLSRYAVSTEKGADEHVHVHEGEAVAHPIERVVDGRRRVLGLFYLPPHTRVVLDLGLEATPELAQEVFLAEAAHAVDYHFLTPEMRRRFVNAVHNESLPEGASVADGVAFRLDGHECSWFDVGPYSKWVGEAWMEGFCEATSDVRVTIQLDHPVGPEDRALIRSFLGIETAPPAPEPEEEPVDLVDDELAKALLRFLAGRSAPRYLRAAGQKWLNR